METRCYLCGKSIRELVEEETRGSQPLTELHISIDTEISFPYHLCETCKEFLSIVIPQVLVGEKVLKYDKTKEKYITEN